MKKYLALLRGINVGGKNTISMAELKKTFEKAGFSDVSTYINSGNIIFSYRETEPLKLQKKCSKLIAENFDLDIKISVIEAGDYAAAFSKPPVWWDKDKESKHNAIFVIAPAKSQEIIRQIGEIKPEYEKLDYKDFVIFWSAPIKTFSKTRLTKYVTTTPCEEITVRNSNTAKKLLALLQ